MVDRIDFNRDVSPLFNQDRDMQQQLLEQINQADMMQRMGSTDLSRQEEISTRGDLAEFAVDFRSTIGELEITAGDLVSSNQFEISAFDLRSVEVSDTEVATATVEDGAERQELELEIEELARAQEDISAEFERDELDFETGEFELSFEQAGVEETLNLEVDEDDTNIEVLTRLGEEIDALELDISAEVIEENEEVSLEITSDEVGSQEEFIVEDISGSGDLLSQLELETVTEASDAVVEIAGLEADEFEVLGDQIRVDESEVEIDALDTGEVTVEIESDTETIQEGIEDFVSAFNEAITFMEDSATNGDLDQLQDRFTNLARFESSDLRSIGVEVNREGQLSISEERLEDSLSGDVDRVESRLGGRIGFASQVERLAEDTLRTSPSQFMETRDSESEEISLLELGGMGFYNQAGRLTSPFSFGQNGLLIDFFL